MPAGANRSGIKKVEHLHFSRKAAWSPVYSKANTAKREKDRKSLCPFSLLSDMKVLNSFTNVKNLYNIFVKGSYFSGES
jgi:hypothetical protein